MNIKHIFCLLSGIAAMTSCSLDEEARSFSTSENFYQNENQCRAAANSCYLPLKSLYTYQMMIATECVTDMAYSRSATQDADLDISPAQPRFGANVWEYCYKGVRYCNAAIAGTEGSPIDDEKKLPIIGECKVLRAFYYWLLTCFFGNVPFYTCDVSDNETLAEVASLPRMPADSTRDWLIDDLWSCVGELEQIRSSEVSENRAGAALGYMLIAKMAQWNGEWQVSLDACEKLVGIYGDLSQYPLSDLPFRNKNIAESIFEIQHTYTAGGLIYTSNVACMCMPYPRSGNKYNGVVIEELGGNATCWAPAQANDYLVNDLFHEQYSDLRRDMCIVRSWNGTLFDSMKSTQTTAFLGPKFWCPDMQTNHDSNNYRVFRYADVLLMMAENHCMLQDDMAAAKDCLNTVKRRAGIADFTRESWTRLKDEIMAERGRELFGEFQRKFDLVRWGTWYEVTYKNTRRSKVKENILPCHRYYPIPDTQVAYSGYALDNDEYKQYGL